MPCPQPSNSEMSLRSASTATSKSRSIAGASPFAGSPRRCSQRSAGAGLMGGAVWAALDGEYRFAQLPEIARLALRQVGERASNIARKADRMTLLARAHERPPDASRFDDDTQRRSRDRARAPVHSRRDQSRRQPSRNSHPKCRCSIPSSSWPRTSSAVTMLRRSSRPASYRSLCAICCRLPPTARVAATVRNDDVLYSVRQAMLSNSNGEALRPTLTASIGHRRGQPRLRRRGQPSRRRSRVPAIAENMNSVAKTDDRGDRRQHLERTDGHREEGRRPRRDFEELDAIAAIGDARSIAALRLARPRRRVSRKVIASAF